MIRATTQVLQVITIGQEGGREVGWVELGSVGELLRRVRAERPRMVLVRVDQPAGEGVRAIEELRRRWPGLVVVAVAGVHDERVERAVREAGVHCYVQGGLDLGRIGEVLGGVVGRGRGPCRDPTGGRGPPEERAHGPPGKEGP